MLIKTCTKCKTDYSATAEFFYRKSKSRDGLSPVCKNCHNKYDKKYYQQHIKDKKKYDRQYHQENREERRNCSLKRDYGINVVQYNLMFDAQSGCCAICKVHQSQLKKRLHVDHNHKTGKVRGLLCPRCNTKLGVVEDKDFLVKSKFYLKGI